MADRNTGRQLNYGNVPLFDLYIVKPEIESDTVRLHINQYSKGIINVPLGLKLMKMNVIVTVFIVSRNSRHYYHPEY